ncbi:autoinducer binding domain-containing protein, partial [Azospirillum sp. B4]|uniref:autoinducer binding domain-containing protein n=1 Tax=Azospirillum sp. B4 TaxID=95605 RepID=UPI0005C88C3A
MDTLETALSRIAGCDSVDDMPKVFHSIIQGFGYEGFSYIDARMVRDRTGATVVPYHQTTCRPDFAEVYIREEFHRYDPVLARAARTNAAFSWADIPDFNLGRRRGQKTTGQRVMEAAEAYGLQQGYVIPAHALDHNGQLASSILSLFWGQTPADMARATPAWLRLAGLSYHERMLALRPGLQAQARETPALPALTDGKRTCFAGRPRGKTWGEP